MRILSITGNRADYDLMSYLYKYFNEDEDIDFGLVVTGAHLTLGYEDSLRDIYKDGNHVIAEVENILNSDSASSRAKSTGILLSALTDIVKQFRPDVMIAPGDREEVICAAVVCGYMDVPFLHFFGGDYAVSGHVDNLVRHAASKMATAHFVATDEHADRLLAMGEEKKRIFRTGSVALDKFSEEPWITREELLKRLGREDFGPYALLIYHPPAEIVGKNEEIERVLKTLKEKGINTIVSYPNTDHNSSEIIRIYQKYMNDEQFYFYRNLDRNTFINLYRHAEFQIGNSSSGVAEAASVPLPVVNIGTRQRNRGNTDNVLFGEKVDDSLGEVIDKARSAEYKESIKDVVNIYGDGKSSRRAYEIIKNTDFSQMLRKLYDPIIHGGK